MRNNEHKYEFPCEDEIDAVSALCSTLKCTRPLDLHVLITDALQEKKLASTSSYLAVLRLLPEMRPALSEEMTHSLVNDALGLNSKRSVLSSVSPNNGYPALQNVVYGGGHPDLVELLLSKNACPHRRAKNKKAQNCFDFAKHVQAEDRVRHRERRLSRQDRAVKANAVVQSW